MNPKSVNSSCERAIKEPIEQQLAKQKYIVGTARLDPTHTKKEGAEKCLSTACVGERILISMRTSHVSYFFHS
jgi:hypothetical protein